MYTMTVPCAGCGTSLERFYGDTNIDHEFCGRCNGKYYESLNPEIDPVGLAILEALNYDTHISHARGNLGIYDENCCSACIAYYKRLNREKDPIYGNLPRGLDHDGQPLWVRTLRVFLRDLDAGKITGVTTEGEDTVRMELREYDRRNK